MSTADELASGSEDEKGLKRVKEAERFQNTPSLICILPSFLNERDIENNTFNSYANK